MENLQKFVTEFGICGTKQRKLTVKSELLELIWKHFGKFTDKEDTSTAQKQKETEYESESESESDSTQRQKHKVSSNSNSSSKKHKVQSNLVIANEVGTFIGREGIC